MSDNIQSGDAEFNSPNTTTEKILETQVPRRRRRTTLTTSEDDNDRAFTNEDIAAEAKIEAIDESIAGSEPQAQSKAKSTEAKISRRRRTSAPDTATESEEIKPKGIPKPTIGSSIPPSFVNQVKTSRKRT